MQELEDFYQYGRSLRQGALLVKALSEYAILAGIDLELVALGSDRLRVSKNRLKTATNIKEGKNIPNHPIELVHSVDDGFVSFLIKDFRITLGLCSVSRDLCSFVNA